MDTKAFLEEYERLANASSSVVDRVLARLLIAFDEEIKPLYDNPYDFHKMFRSIDVIELGEGKIDSAIWLLIDSSKLFWEVFVKYFISKTNTIGDGQTDTAGA